MLRSSLGSNVELNRTKKLFYIFFFPKEAKYTLSYKFLDVAKYNLGKLKLQANAISGLLLRRT